MTPSSNMYGATGLIDMPSGEAQSDGQLWVTTSHFGPISRNTLSFQITPRISASFRYLGIRNWNKHIPSWLDTYYDRSFDIRFKALDESRYLPAITFGLQDFVGTGILAGEYVVATKTLTPNIKVTAGLGWGRLASRGDIGSPFGVRPNANVGLGGKFDPKVWFRGPAAPFGGVEWKINNDWTFKGEYSSDNYRLEAGSRKTFDHKSPFNFGVEYQPSDYYRLGAYYMYGSKVGISGQFFLNPKKHVESGITDRAPHPVKPRPNRDIDPDAYSSAWITQENALPILRNNVGKWLKDDGIVVESIGFASANTVRVEIENTRFSNGAQAIGRTARVLSNVMPASVEVFEIVPLSNGVPAAKIVVNRSDLEALEFSPDAIEQMAGRVNISGDTRPDPGIYRDKDLYPKFEWAFAPSLDLGLFDPNSPVRADVRARLSASYEIAPGYIFEGAISQKLFGNLSRKALKSDSVLQHVRTDSLEYTREGKFALDQLTFSAFNKPGQNLYSRLTIGYLERMFGGVSGELLWKRPDSPLALGVEMNYVRQREFSQGLGFQDYGVWTGHASAYYQFKNGFNAQLDVGRYLAGDVGATFSLEREFANGIIVGAFATKTDVSAQDFGEGSFDKGIRVTIPVGWGLGMGSKKTLSTTLRPITRDGGARLNVNGRLYQGLKGYHSGTLDAQFGRFWQ